MTHETELIAETDSLLVYNKPTNISILRDRSGADDLWTKLTAHAKRYLVHRLDKGTSGVFLVAKTQARQSELTRAFSQHQVRKFYLAQVVGKFPQGRTFTINLPLKKGRKSRYRVAGLRDGIKRTATGWHHPKPEEGLEAVTRVRCLKVAAGRSWLLVQPLSGRTHQLRVHLSWIGFPILGDNLYGSASDPKQKHERLMLHCHRLVLPGGETYSVGL